MKIIRVAGVVLLIVLLLWVMALSGQMYAFIDFASLIFVVFICLSLLLFTNQISDYLRAFRFSAGNHEFTTKELKASENTMSFSIKVMFLAGLLGSLVGFVQIGHLGDPDSLTFVRMAVSSLTFVYACILNLIQISIKSILTKEIIYRNHEK